MKTIFKIIGILLACSSAIFSLALTFIVKSDGKISEDLLGFPIPAPPQWTSFVPFLGGFLDYCFQIFSIHGVISFILPLISLSIGFQLIATGETKKKAKTMRPSLKRRTPDPTPPEPVTTNRNEKTIQILGEEIDSENMPILYKWAQTHPDTLAAQLQSIANAWHEGDIGSAMIAFESDLAHEKGFCEDDEVDQELELENPFKVDADVSLHNMIETYTTTPMEYILPIPLGVDQGDIAQYDDLVSLGHILMTGTTGSGKSNFGNVIIASLMTLLPPSKVNFILFDFKRVEFSVYSKNRYLRSDVIVDIDIAFLELEKLIIEKRIRLSKENIDESPYIVVLIDSFSDWIIADKERFESGLRELMTDATKAKIHVVMWDSRLSTSTYTLHIMKLFPTKICFNVVDKQGSETFIGTVGAEKLHGAGDMLLLKEVYASPIHLRSPLISDEEVVRVVSEWRGKVM